MIFVRDMSGFHKNTMQPEIGPAAHPRVPRAA